MSLRETLCSVALHPEVEAAIDRIPDRLAVNELGYDPWGLHVEQAKIYLSLGRLAYRYFRPQVMGVENLPEGRMLVVPNHSGQLPFDGLVVTMACLLHGKPPRLLRPLAERWVPTLPWVNLIFSRSGVVLGDPINARNLLEEDNALLVFPEGVRGSGKPWAKRYQLEPFGRGFMRMALHTGTPIVPAAVVGAEESVISLRNAKTLARFVGAPYFPVPALLPILGPLAFLPLPTRFHVYFGEPLRFSGAFDDEDNVIEDKVRMVEQAVAKLIARGLSERQGIF